MLLCPPWPSSPSKMPLCPSCVADDSTIVADEVGEAGGVEAGDGSGVRGGGVEGGDGSLSRVDSSSVDRSSCGVVVEIRRLGISHVRTSLSVGTQLLHPGHGPLSDGLAWTSAAAERLEPKRNLKRTSRMRRNQTLASDRTAELMTTIDRLTAGSTVTWKGRKKRLTTGSRAVCSRKSSTLRRRTVHRTRSISRIERGKKLRGMLMAVS